MAKIEETARENHSPNNYEEATVKMSRKLLVLPLEGKSDKWIFIILPHPFTQSKVSQHLS